MATITSTVPNTMKRPKSLPLQDPNNPNQPVNLQVQQVQPVQAQRPKQNAGTQASDQSLQQVNQMAQQGFQSPTVQLTSQKTQQLLQDPNQGVNYQNQINNRLTQYDRERAQAVETARQGMAGASGSSLNQNALLDIALRGAEGKADLQSQLESEADSKRMDAIYKSLAEGRATSGLEQGVYNTNIDALIKARGAAEPELDRNMQTSENAINRGMEVAKMNQNANLQMALANIDAKVKQGLQASEQDWKSVQNELDRQSQVALQRGDIEGQKQIAQLKSDYEIRSLVQQQNFTGAQNALDRQLQESLQSNDINATRNNLQRQLDFDKEMELSGRTFTAEQNALNRALEGTLKNLDIESATELTKLKSKLDSGMLTQEQDWKSVQNALDREAAIALKNQDTTSQIKIMQLKSEIDAAQQNAQRQWQTAEREASQVYSTGERLGDQDFQTTTKYLEQKLQEATLKAQLNNSIALQSNEFSQQEKMANITSQLDEARAGNDFRRTEVLTRLQSSLQAGLQDDAQAAAKELQTLDIANQRYLEEQKNALQLKMQTQNFDQEQKMKYLDSQLAEARATNDVGRQKDILKFQTMQDIEKISAQQGADAAIEKIRGDLEMALQKNDHVHAEALQRSELTFKAKEAAMDRAIDQARVDLEKKQVDMAQVDQQYEQIRDMVEQGILDPQAEYDFMMGTLKAHGVNTSGDSYNIVNAQEKAEKALQVEYDMQKKQFMQTHPELVVKNDYTDVNGNKVKRGDLMPEGLKALNDFMNFTLYGEKNAQQKQEEKFAGYKTETDIPYAQVGDKFNITTNEAKDHLGVTIPQGTYHVENRTVTTGSKFFGTKKTNNHYVLVNDKTGDYYEVRSNSDGAVGNIVSNLWAGDA